MTPDDLAENNWVDEGEEDGADNSPANGPFHGGQVNIAPPETLALVETAFLASAASLIWLINYYFPLALYYACFSHSHGDRLPPLGKTGQCDVRDRVGLIVNDFDGAQKFHFPDSLWLDGGAVGGTMAIAKKLAMVNVHRHYYRHDRLLFPILVLFPASRGRPVAICNHPNYGIAPRHF